VRKARYTLSIATMIRITQTFIYYIVWHYSRGLKDYARFFLTFLWFVYNFFSIPILLGSLFSPWRRMGEAYHAGFSPSAFFSSLIVNTLMRVVGLCVRTVVIIIGTVALITTALLGSIGIFIWLALPLILTLLFLWGIALLMSSLSFHL